MGAGVDEGREVVTNSEPGEGVSGDGPICASLRVAGDFDDVNEVDSGL